MRLAPIVLAVTLVSGACKKDSVPAGVLTPEVEALLLQRLNAPDAGEMTDAHFDAIRERVHNAARERGR